MCGNKGFEMNERIKELIAECTHTVTDYSSGIDSSYEEFDKEKFAELIVRECARAVDKVYETAGPDYGCYDWGATFADGNDVLKHFGVEK